MESVLGSEDENNCVNPSLMVTPITQSHLEVYTASRRISCL